MLQEDKIKDFTKTYIRAYKLSFKHIIFILVIVLAFFLSLNIFGKKLSPDQIDYQLNIKKIKIIWEFNKLLSQNIENRDLVIYILQWYLNIQWDFIRSIDNLITYKWFIIPKYLSIYKTLILKDIWYFSNPNYDILELKSFIYNIVLTPKQNYEKIKNVQLPLQDSISNTFKIWCVLDTLLYNATCDHYIQTFLNEFFIYNIKNNYDEFEKIFYKLSKNKKYKGTLCENIQKYVLYSNDTNQVIKDLFTTCNDSWYQTIKRIDWFIKIQDQLEKKHITLDMYNDRMLNEYKLISLQQLLYQDISNNRIEIDNISLYLDFLKELLKKNWIDNFYKDEIYRFNNQYLIKEIEKPLNYFNETKKIGINSIIDNINIINQWNSLIWFKWLEYQIINKNLIEILTWYISGDQLSNEQKITRKIASIPYLTVTARSISWNDITIDWYFQIYANASSDNYSTASNEETKLIVILNMTYQNNSLIVKKILIPEKQNLNSVMNNLLFKNWLTIGETYSYISKNLSLYDQNSINLNQVNQDLICENLRQDPIVDTLNQCDLKEILITTNKIQYKFLLNNFQIIKLEISNKSLENQIQNTVIIWKTDSSNLMNKIEEIISIKTQKEYEWSYNSISIIQTIQEYLWDEPNDIAEKSWKVLIDFSLWEFNFIWNYNLTNNSIWPLYFKDILSDNKPLSIKGFNLILDDLHQTQIDSFKSDTENYIKTLDFIAWKTYSELKK